MLHEVEAFDSRMMRGGHAGGVSLVKGWASRAVLTSSMVMGIPP